MIFTSRLPEVALCFRLSSLRPFPNSDSGSRGKWATAFLDFAAPGFRWWRSGTAPRSQNIKSVRKIKYLMLGYFDAAPTYPQGILVEVRRLTLHHLDGHDAQGPNVHFGSVGLAGHDLRSHPIRRAHHSASLTLFWSDLSAEPKVRCEGKEKRVRRLHAFS